LRRCGVIFIYIDGSCQPQNPGGLGCWAWLALEKGGREMGHDYGCVGSGPEVTNNVMEYTAAIEALEWALESGQDDVLVFSDSQLLVNQVTGKYRCIQPHLQVLLDELKKLVLVVGAKFEWVPREMNEAADALTQQAYEEARKDSVKGALVA